MKRQQWDSITGRFLAVMLAALLAGSNVNYAAVSDDSMPFVAVTEEQATEEPSIESPAVAVNVERAVDVFETGNQSETESEECSIQDEELTENLTNADENESGSDGSEETVINVN